MLLQFLGCFFSRFPIVIPLTDSDCDIRNLCGLIICCWKWPICPYAHKWPICPYLGFDTGKFRPYPSSGPRRLGSSPALFWVLLEFLALVRLKPMFLVSPFQLVAIKIVPFCILMAKYIYFVLFLYLEKCKCIFLCGSGTERIVLLESRYGCMM